MKPIATRLAPLSLALAMAACVPRTAPPPQVPPVVLRPLPAPAPVAPPTASRNWMDAPQTAGDWRYATTAGVGYATFGQAGQVEHISLWCDRRAGEVVVSKPGAASANAQMTIRTEAQTRALRTTTKMYDARPVPVTEARIRAADGLLDAMALSKGRFAVEVAGSPTLYLPSWAEVTRVIEDCR